MAFVLILLLAAGWLYRDELVRWGRRLVAPKAAAARVGHPSEAAGRRAAAKLDSLVRSHPDSILLTPDEMASLLAAGSDLLSGGAADSISVELGERTVRVRTMVNTARLPQRVLDLLPMKPGPWEEVIGQGTLTPVRAGVAELALSRVLVRGLPIPNDLVARVLSRLTGQASDGRLVVRLPSRITGFRVRPFGVAIYPSGAGR